MSSPIGGFMPIPLAMMIPFMATQSLVMGESFGKAFQFGKRKISAMSNEEFNKLNIEDVASEMFKAYDKITPKLQESMEKSQELQEFIVKQMLLMVPKLIESLLDTATAGIPRAQPIPPTGTGTTPRIPTPETTAADVFKTTTTNNSEVREPWVAVKTSDRPLDSRVISQAKQELYLGFPPSKVRTLVADSIIIIQRPSQHAANGWNYRVRIKLRW